MFDNFCRIQFDVLLGVGAGNMVEASGVMMCTACGHGHSSNREEAESGKGADRRVGVTAKKRLSLPSPSGMKGIKPYYVPSV